MPNDLFLSHFNTLQPVFQATAPGRLDVMGGIADYSGSMVLQMPIRQQTTISLALRTDGVFNIKSIHSHGQISSYSIHYTALQENKNEVDYTFARKQLNQSQDGQWAAYILGCFLVLQRERKILVEGADILVESDVPLGKGVSSSASLEVAVLKAISKAYTLELSKTELPALAQKAENLVVGAPCGLMDQLACYLGERGKLLPILCQPDQVYEAIPIPENVFFVGIDSSVRHSVGAASYAQVRTAAFMGYAMIARQLGITDEKLADAKKKSDRSDLPYKGYLANITPAVFEEDFSLRLPYKMHGKYFKQYYPVHLDPVTEVEEDNFYAILECTRHPVYENFRVNTFALLLQYVAQTKDNSLRKQCLQQLGELMYQSHASYTTCGLGDVNTDELVKAVRQQEGKGVYGAKITGGGSGGTVCILCEGEEGLQTAKKIHQAYQDKHKKEVIFFDAL